jgi:hypothetical protein
MQMSADKQMLAEAAIRQVRVEYAALAEGSVEGLRAAVSAVAVANLGGAGRRAAMVLTLHFGRPSPAGPGPA